MGQRCSCLFNRPEDEYSFTKPSERIDKVRLNNFDRLNFLENKIAEDQIDIINIQQDFSPNLENFNLLILAIYKKFVWNPFLQNLQKPTITPTGNPFYKIKPDAEEYHNNSYRPYDKSGWKIFYKEDDKRFNLDYGTVTQAEILNLTEHYSGQTNTLGHKHGFGILRKADMSKFEGYWINDKFTGWGRIIEPTGIMREGYFIHSKQNDKGIKRMRNGDYYEGQFKDDLMDGTGIEEIGDYFYEGDFRDDKRDGKGFLKNKINDESYKGEFRDNIHHGLGLYKWANGDTYEGAFVEGKMHGRGTYRWPDKNEYVGEYINNIKEGRGVFKWANGRIFSGPFKNGKPHGEGKLTKDNKTLDVEFIDGVINKNYKKSKIG